MQVIHGDCLDVLAGMADASFDAVVTDPPYSWAFMGAEWDDHASPREFQAWCESWAKQLLRVLKPGGHLLAFGGPRSYHRLACGLEDAGFEMRDSIIAWTFATGFPKSLDVGKAIDKRGGNAHLADEIGCAIRQARERRGWTTGQADRHFCGGTTNWTWYEGRKGVCRPPAPEDFTRIVAEWPELAPLAVKVAEADREVVGAGRSGPAAVAFVRNYATEYDVTAPATELAQRFDGYGTALKPAWEPVVVARKPLIGTVAQNVERWGVGGINVDGCRIPTSVADRAAMERANTPGSGRFQSARETADGHGMGRSNPGEPYDPAKGRWPTNLLLCHSPSCVEGRCVEDCHVAEMDRQSGIRTSGSVGPEGFSGPYRAEVYGKYARNEIRPETVYGDSGGASRFYPCFRFEAKADSSERMAGPDGTKHVTVKPVDLMRWLVRLVSPPSGGLILDPFAGSGSTLVAAFMEDVECVGIEKDARYVPIIEKRLEQAKSRGAQTSLFG